MKFRYRGWRPCTDAQWVAWLWIHDGLSDAEIERHNPEAVVMRERLGFVRKHELSRPKKEGNPEEWVRGPCVECEGVYPRHRMDGRLGTCTRCTAELGRLDFRTMTRAERVAFFHDRVDWSTTMMALALGKEKGEDLRLANFGFSRAKWGTRWEHAPCRDCMTPTYGVDLSPEGRCVACGGIQDHDGRPIVTWLDAERAASRERLRRDPMRAQELGQRKPYMMVPGIRGVQF
jgi:hypothetical protein